VVGCGGRVAGMGFDRAPNSGSKPGSCKILGQTSVLWAMDEKYTGNDLVQCPLCEKTWPHPVKDGEVASHIQRHHTCSWRVGEHGTECGQPGHDVKLMHEGRPCEVTWCDAHELEFFRLHKADYPN